MTTSTETAAAADMNGQGPPPAAGDGEAVTRSERVMGLVGIAFAVGLLMIGVDLATGGAVSRLFAGLAGERDGSAGG